MAARSATRFTTPSTPDFRGVVRVSYSPPPVPQQDATTVLRRLYRGVDGFDIARREEARVRKAKSSATYGELRPAATLHLLEALQLTRRDVFYDLGSGVGKVVLLAAMVTPARRCIGVELAPGRVADACRVLAQAQRDRLVSTRRVQLREDDILATDLSDATVVYTCSTAFPTPFMGRLQRKLAALQRPLTFVTLQVLDDHPAFERHDVLRLDVTWRRRAKVYVYGVNGAARRGPGRRSARG
jgi:hypothetical protein